MHPTDRRSRNDYGITDAQKILRVQLICDLVQPVREPVTTVVGEHFNHMPERFDRNDIIHRQKHSLVRHAVPNSQMPNKAPSLTQYQIRLIIYFNPMRQKLRTDILLITDDGTVIRTPVSSISTHGRNTQGVRIMRVEEGSQVVCVAPAEAEEDEEGEAELPPVEDAEELSAETDETNEAEVQPEGEDDDI